MNPLESLEQLVKGLPAPGKAKYIVLRIGDGPAVGRELSEAIGQALFGIGPAMPKPDFSADVVPKLDHNLMGAYPRNRAERRASGAPSSPGAGTP